MPYPHALELHHERTMTKLAGPRSVVAPLLALLLTLVVSGAALAQNAVIAGRVTNEQGQAVAGAQVFIQSLNVLTTANAEGNYTLTVPNAVGQRATLTARFIGFVPHSRPITLSAERQTQDFVLKADPFRLEEVVVTGVTDATSTKKLPISVSRVSEDQLKNVPASNPIMALAGKAAGVRVSPGRGAPGSAPTIRLRGSTNIDVGGSQPLILIDGVITQNSMADIDANDVESIEVLKGAAAASMYGSSAANGVVNITTKRGRNIGDNRVAYTVRSEYGQSGVEHFIPLNKHHHYETNPDGRIRLVNGSRVVSTDQIADNPFPTSGESRWRNQLDTWLTNGAFLSNNLQIAMRRGNTNLNTSYTNDRNEGIVPFIDGQFRQNFRLNVDQGLRPDLDLSASLTYGLVKNDYDPNGDQGWFALLQAPPDIDLTRPNDLEACPTATAPTCVDYFSKLPDANSPNARGNPLYGLANQDFRLRRERMLGSFTGRYRPAEWLRLEASYGTDRLNRSEHTYQFKGFLNEGGQQGQGRLNEFRRADVSQNSQINATATRLLMGNLLSTTRVAYLFEDERREDFATLATRLNVFDVPDLQAADPTQLSATNLRTKAITRNYSAGQSFDYKDRYILDALYRRDESSLFGPESRSSDFYRVAGRYRIAEDFAIPGFQELSIRGARGTAGLRPEFDWQYETYTVIGGQVNKNQLGNKALKPAIQTETEFGLNATFLNRFDLELVQANRVTKGAFLNVPLSLAASGGFVNQRQNAADVEAKTTELALQTRILDRADFNWSASLTGDHTTQQITRLNRAPFRVNAGGQGQDVFYYKEGEALGVIYGQQWVRDVSQLPAGTDPSLYTKNHLGFVVLAANRGLPTERPIAIVDATGSAATIKIGDVNPDFTFGFANNLRYKGFAAYALLDGQKGGEVYNFSKQWMFQDHRHGAQDQSGIAAADKISLPFFSSGLYNNLVANDFFVEDASFVKLRELSLSYTLDQSVIQKMRLGGRASSVKLALIGRNLKTWTDYSGFDPDVTSGNDFNFRIDGFRYPNFRTITGQVEIIF
jgi:TonB-linked SusC/RagA family outer membrane protein